MRYLRLALPNRISCTKAIEETCFHRQRVATDFLEDYIKNDVALGLASGILPIMDYSSTNEHHLNIIKFTGECYVFNEEQLKNFIIAIETALLSDKFSV